MTLRKLTQEERDSERRASSLFLGLLTGSLTAIAGGFFLDGGHIGLGSVCISLGVVFIIIGIAASVK